MSGHQLSRMLGVTQKTAWFMSHRIREAMRPAGGEPPLGGEGKVVEADETFIGGLTTSQPEKVGPSQLVLTFAIEPTRRR